jgi:hypothetical protein
VFSKPSILTLELTFFLLSLFCGAIKQQAGLFFGFFKNGHWNCPAGTKQTKAQPSCLKVIFTTDSETIPSVQLLLHRHTLRREA